MYKSSDLSTQSRICRICRIPRQASPCGVLPTTHHTRRSQEGQQLVASTNSPKLLPSSTSSPPQLGGDSGRRCLVNFTILTICAQSRHARLWRSLGPTKHAKIAETNYKKTATKTAQNSQKMSKKYENNTHTNHKKNNKKEQKNYKKTQQNTQNKAARKCQEIMLESETHPLYCSRNLVAGPPGRKIM